MDASRLKRPVYPMPADIMERLETERLTETYRRRPPYQQNDYIGWISRAKQPQTRQKRVDQMIDELRGGERYMGMRYNAKQ